MSSNERQVVGVIAAGGGLGALARYAVGVRLPAHPHQLPWATWWVNVVGCLLIGALMVVTVEYGRGHRLLRPFLGIGVLGGFTTFSTFALDIRNLLAAGAPATAAIYIAVTLASGLAAVVVGVACARVLAERFGPAGAR